MLREDFFFRCEEGHGMKRFSRWYSRTFASEIV